MPENNKMQNLVNYVKGLYEKKDGKELYLKYRKDIERITPQEAFEVLNILLKGSIGSKSRYNWNKESKRRKKTSSME